MTKKKNIGISRALEYSPNPAKDLSPKIHYLAGYNQAAEDYICSESHSIQETLITEIMVLREAKKELMEMLQYLHNFSKGMHFHPGSVTDKEITELLNKYK